MRILIRNAEVLVTMDAARRELRGTDVWLENGVIAGFGTASCVADQIIDATGCVVTPGLVNTHHHLYQTMTRAVPGGQDALLFGWLKTLYPIWARMGPEHMQVSARIGLAELALSGCSLSSDHLYIYTNGVRLEDTIEAANDIGLRFHATRGAMSIGESEGGLPPDSLVENDEDIAYSLEKFGCRPGQYAEDLGWTGQDVWHAHCVKLDACEIGLFARSQTGIAHCPCSNCRLGSGIAPVRQMRDAGVRVGLGVDGAASNDSGDLIGEARQAMLLQRVQNGADAMSAREALEMATLGGAQVLGRDDCGTLAAGMRADIAIWDLTGVQTAGAWDPVAALVLCGPHRVKHLVVEGRQVVRDFRLTTWDLDHEIARQNRLARALVA